MNNKSLNDITEEKTVLKTVNHQKGEDKTDDLKLEKNRSEFFKLAEKIHRDCLDLLDDIDDAIFNISNISTDITPIMDWSNSLRFKDDENFIKNINEDVISTNLNSLYISLANNNMGMYTFYELSNDIHQLLSKYPNTTLGEDKSND